MCVFVCRINTNMVFPLITLNFILRKVLWLSLELPISASMTSHFALESLSLPPKN